ncbi:MarR family winged helix-turn-helix transcriptional regulator [Megamonas hypermegale]|uniref:MarR family winged helix-turn-helix transcriptional regulator n=1 Tax=Megamonas hypermegale TaxID=158847 RepID=UPI001EF4A615|nr:MarR family transcriptional regulator [Megamonas hypermegale]
MITISISEEKLEQASKLVHQLYQTTRAMSKSINRALDSTNIYGSEWIILKTIRTQGTMTQTVLANCLNIEPAAISKTLRQLEKKHLITRQSGTDKREKYIYLTPLALEQYDTWHQIIKQNSKRVFEAVNENEQATLMKLLGKIRQHINDDN